MTEHLTKPEGQPYEYTFGHQYVAYEKNGRQLIVTHGLGDRMRFKHPLAAYADPTTAEMDGAAFDILFKACGGGTERFDKARFEHFLDVIIDFEIKYSNNEERHQHRTPDEEEILKIMTEGGYFER